MAQRVYATASDYYDFTGGDDPNEDAEGEPIAEPTTDATLNAKLRRASTIIDGLIRQAKYDVDEEYYPTDADVADALKEATCAQVEWFEETDDLTGAGSQEGTVSIGSVSLGARGRTTGNGAPAAGQSRIAPEAVSILVNAGIVTAVVSHS